MWIMRSPLDTFEIYSLLELNIKMWDMYIPLTNMTLIYVLGVWLVLMLYILSYEKGERNKIESELKENETLKVWLLWLRKSGQRLVISKWSLWGDVLYNSVLNIVRSQISNGLLGERYFPLLLSLFSLTLVLNLLGLITYGYSVTANFAYCFYVSITVILSVTLLGLSKHKWEFLGLLVPSGTPLILVPLLTMIELISYIARAVSLGLRLSANILAGHMLLSILSGFIYAWIITGWLSLVLGWLPIVVVVMIIILECAISVIQAYILSVLTASYIKDAELLH